MGRYLGSWKIDDIVRIHIQTSSVTTGAATDADAAPTWRIYEDDTATPVTTGSFSTLNAQVGLYVAAVTLASAIGYEKGKSYGVRTQATVGGVIGADVHSFQIEAEVDANTVSGTAPTGFLTAGAITDGAFTSPKFGAGFITAGSITDGALTAPKFGAGFITAGSFSGNALAGMAVTVSSTARAAIVDEVWDEPKAGHTTADTYGEYLDATLSGIGAAGAVTVGATAVAAIADAVWAETAANYTTAGSMGFVLQDSQSLGAIVDAIWDEPKSGHTTADTYGEYLDATVSGIGAAGAVTVGSTAVAAIATAVQSAVTAGSIGAVTVGATAAAAIAAQVTAGSIGAVTVGSTAASAIAVATQALAMTIGATAASAIATAVQALPMTIGSTARAAIVDEVWDEPKAGHTTADTYGEYLDSTTGAIKTDTAAISSRIPAALATSGSMKADITHVNSVSVTGNGQGGSEWGPGAS